MGTSHCIHVQTRRFCALSPKCKECQGIKPAGLQVVWKLVVERLRRCELSFPLNTRNVHTVHDLCIMARIRVGWDSFEPEMT